MLKVHPDFYCLTSTETGAFIPLSPLETRVVEYLERAAPRPVSQEELMARIWGDPAPLETTPVRMIVSQIRAKAGEKAILTRHRIGYVWAGLE